MVRRIQVFLVLTSILVHCSSFDKSLLEQKINIDKRFSGYTVFVDSESLKAVFPDSHYDEKYRQNVKQMLLDRMQIEGENSANQGYISIIVREIQLRDERLWMLGLVTVLPALFGMPYQRIDAQVNLDFALMNQKGKILRVFSVEGRNDVPNGLLYGYSDFRESEIPADTAYAKMAIFKSLDRAMIDAKIQLAYLASRMEQEK